MKVIMLKSNGGLKGIQFSTLIEGIVRRFLVSVSFLVSQQEIEATTRTNSLLSQSKFSAVCRVFRFYFYIYK